MSWTQPSAANPYSSPYLERFRKEQEREREQQRFDHYVREQEQLRQQQEKAICVRRAPNGSCVEYRAKDSDPFAAYRTYQSDPFAPYAETAPLNTTAAPVHSPSLPPMFVVAVILGIAATTSPLWLPTLRQWPSRNLASGNNKIKTEDTQQETDLSLTTQLVLTAIGFYLCYLYWTDESVFWWLSWLM